MVADVESDPAPTVDDTCAAGELVVEKGRGLMIETPGAMTRQVEVDWRQVAASSQWSFVNKTLTQGLCKAIGGEPHHSCAIPTREDHTPPWQEEGP